MLDELWTKYGRDKDEVTKKKLLEYYLPLTRIIADRLSISLPSYVDKEDFANIGFLGLVQALERFDASRGIKFETFASIRIKGAMLDAIRVNDWVPVSVRQKARNYQEALASLTKKLGRDPVDEELATELGLALPKYRQMMNQIQIVTVVPLEDISSISSGENGDRDFTKQIERDELKTILAEQIKKLTEKEALVISLYYYEQLTLREISEILKVTEARISQIHTKAIFKLRNSLSEIKTDLI